MPPNGFAVNFRLMADSAASGRKMRMHHFETIALRRRKPCVHHPGEFGGAARAKNRDKSVTKLVNAMALAFV
jgi:hypothetical protein